jgi:uncharacterized protein YndB with AHSA1/START domain
MKSTTGETTGGRELVITRTLDAPRSLVWEVCTQPEHAQHWWGPKDFTVPVLELDPRIGGAWRAVLRGPDGKEYPQGGVCTEFVPPERLSFTLKWEGSPEPEMLCTYTFAERGDKTEMTFRKGPFTSPESYEGEFGGWSECFDRLAAYMAEMAKQ